MILTHFFRNDYNVFGRKSRASCSQVSAKDIWNLSSQINSIFNAIHCFNPLTPKSDYPISPHNIILESNIKVMRIKEMITNLRSS